MKEVLESDEVMMITRNGIVIRCPVKGIPILGRPAKGVRLISLKEGDALGDVTLIAGEEEAEEESAASAEKAPASEPVEAREGEQDKDRVESEKTDTKRKRDSSAKRRKKSKK